MDKPTPIVTFDIRQYNDILKAIFKEIVACVANMNNKKT